MQNNTISTSIQLNIGDRIYRRTFYTNSREQLYHAFWDYMTLEHRILYSTTVTLLDDTKATQIGFLNREGREDETDVMEQKIF